MNNNYKIPNNAVVLLVGVAGAGKSTLAKKAFNDGTLIVSSDECRKEISGDEKDQSVTAEAFELFYKKIEEGLQEGKRVVADATNIEKFSRERIYEIAKRKNVPIYAIVFNVPLEIIKRQNRMRERVVPEYAIDRMFQKMRKAYYEISNEIPPENIIDIFHRSEKSEKELEEMK